MVSKTNKIDCFKAAGRLSDFNMCYYQLNDGFEGLSPHSMYFNMVSTAPKVAKFALTYSNFT